MYISSETRLLSANIQQTMYVLLLFKNKKYPDVDMPVAITQITGRQIAAEKIPSWKR